MRYFLPFQERKSHFLTFRKAGLANGSDGSIQFIRS